MLERKEIILKLYFVIPFFKDSEFLGDALKSLSHQTYKNWMAVVFDDSIDPKEAAQAKKVIEELGDSRITYSRNPKNMGMSPNMNQGLDQGTKSGCDGITILHADDILDPDYAQSMVESMQKHPEAVAFFCMPKIIDGQGKSRFSFPDWYKTLLLPEKVEHEIILKGFDGIRKLIPGNFIFFPTLCFSVRKLGSERFREDLKMALDFDFTLRFFLNQGTMVGVYTKPLYYYRRHEHNTTNLYNKSLLRFREERDVYLNLGKALEKTGHLELAKEARKLKIVKLNLLFNAAKSALHFDFKSCWNFIRFLLNDCKPSS